MKKLLAKRKKIKQKAVDKFSATIFMSSILP